MNRTLLLTTLAVVFTCCVVILLVCTVAIVDPVDSGITGDGDAAFDAPTNRWGSLAFGILGGAGACVSGRALLRRSRREA
jgi:hypothetical protein